MGTYGSGTYGSGTFGGRRSIPPAQPGDGGSGYSWFAVEVTSEPVPEGPVNVGIFVRLPFEIEAEVQPTTTVGITRALAYSVEQTEPEPSAHPPETGGGTHGYVAGPIGVGQDFEMRIPASVRIKLPRFETTATTKVAVTRRVEFTRAGSVSGVRNVELRFSGMRESADRWGNLLREDEEILTLI